MNTSIIIRPFTSADLPELIKLFQEMVSLGDSTGNDLTVKAQITSK